MRPVRQLVSTGLEIVCSEEHRSIRANLTYLTDNEYDRETLEVALLCLEQTQAAKEKVVAGTVHWGATRLFMCRYSAYLLLQVYCRKRK